MTDTVSDAAVSDEAVEAAAEAMYNANYANDGHTWDTAPEHWKPEWIDSARAALEAAAPLLVAGERARAVNIVQAMHAEPTDDGRGTIIHYTHDMRRDIVAAIQGGEPSA